MARTDSPVREKAEAWPQNLLLWAPDGRFLEASARDWCARWVEESGGEVVLPAPGLAPGTFLSEVNALPMWTRRRAVLLRHAQEASDALAAEVAAYLAKPAPTTALLVEYEGNLNDKRLPVRWREVADLVACRDCTPRNPRAYVQERLRREGFAMDGEALSELVEWSAGETALLAQALDLLTLYKLGEKRIVSEDLAGLLGAGGTPSIWDLQDAFLKGDRRAFVTLSEGARRDPEAAPLAFLGMVARQLRALLLLFGHEARGRKRAQVAFKDVGLGAPFALTKLVAVADRWDEGRVRRALGALSEADLALKGEKGDPWDILERALLKLM